MCWRRLLPACYCCCSLAWCWACPSPPHTSPSGVCCLSSAPSAAACLTSKMYSVWQHGPSVREHRRLRMQLEHWEHSKQICLVALQRNRCNMTSMMLWQHNPAVRVPEKAICTNVMGLSAPCHIIALPLLQHVMSIRSCSGSCSICLARCHLDSVSWSRALEFLMAEVLADSHPSRNR